MDKCSNCYIIDRAKLSYCPDCKKVKKTSQDISTVDVLGKIRDEIEQFVSVSISDVEVMPKNDVLQIIDKYKENKK